ncbi:RsmB/NOP family class I SAM-dependent RNA methyltransferase [Horticoccus sp. 23ND18S-11]|uniref:RsmB/NOP family class I SAM-dependent RNA methyltransferase n=1 Tax=Horticoccus sp. 23ND18S-11 TaxID=3391832 RepID=UPI0039C92AD7
MPIAANQKRTFLRLVAQLRPHWRRDPALPARIQALFSAHREFGSRDRRLYRELLYTTLRHLPWIEPLLEVDADEAVRRVAWLAHESPATAPFRAAFATGDAPAGDKTELLPAWFRAHCPEVFSGAELDAQLRRASLWLRLQTDATGRARVLAEFAARQWPVQPSTLLPDALELCTEPDVTSTDAWKAGAFEVQDLGSQLILASVGVEPGGHWLDACAGAGGKTLQLARLLGPSGRVDAYDIRPAALAELKLRAERARQRVTVLTAPPTDAYDGVLVDAPCSGSGTWRRAPHLKWITTEEQIARSAAIQRALLDQFSARVRPGGRLVYATCSLSSWENEAVANAFLAAHPEFRAESSAPTFDLTPRPPGRLILPSVHNTDGFFVASFRRQ